MKKTAAWLAVHALEQLGVRYIFGIPGVHTTELYDELNSSALITPVLVTHEGGGAFMADAVSRVSDTGIGTLVIVPAAGFTHAASGIGEAFLDGIPMLVLTGGIRSDTGRRYQLHGLDQLALAAALTKAAFRVERHEDVVPTLFDAYRIATGGQPGPVLVEIPLDLQLFPGEAGAVPRWTPPPSPPPPDPVLIRRAADRLLAAGRPGLFVGWGARAATGQIAALAELLHAPVSTTLQGLASFPADHPLHAGFGFSPSAVPAARNAFKGCDALLAVGTRFGEIPTGSFAAAVPPALIHVDICPEVIGANYPAETGIVGDAATVLTALVEEIRRRGGRAGDADGLARQIARDKAAWREEWYAHDSRGRVNPARFFDELRRQMPDDAIAVLDDGNHTYLAAELFPIHRGGRLLTPSDFNAMGYAVPAAIGAKLARPEKDVFAVVGDGCFMMTCMEIATAAARGLGIVFFVFRDGELSQIAQAQQIPYNRKPCTTVGVLNVAGVAQATGAAYVFMPDDAGIAAAVGEARARAKHGPVVVEVAIDYGKRTAFTSGTAKSTFRRFPLSQRLRFAGRALLRRATG
ncbi:thiamine pyrophosphate-binding protein [Azospirillum sp.]|uniref:thiamine pyrophosphate-binding protein n=1 Tax=Azospirillum sp. TaxID=34012 RepID=UPI002D44DDAC|nr:thiamine pyrophosphate-binding protein [Azospirillum sp.]HYF84807.1 thiamine pyrophosphate-binding protein [Azospirillum sp.]